MTAYKGEYKEYLTLKEFSKELYSLEVQPRNEILKEGTSNHHTYGWGFLILSLIGIIFLATITAFYRRRFKLLINVFFNWKLSKQIIRYEKVHSHPVNILLLITFLIFFPLYYALSLSIITPELEFAFLIKSLSIFVLLYFIIKLILYQFSAWLFEEKELFSQYIFQLNLYTKFLGIVLLIHWTLLIYAPIPARILFDLSIAILLLFLVLQTYRGIVIGRSEGKNLFLIILYLCTLEILPWLLIYKSLENSW